MDQIFKAVAGILIIVAIGALLHSLAGFIGSKSFIVSEIKRIIVKLFSHL